MRVCPARVVVLVRVSWEEGTSVEKFASIKLARGHGFWGGILSITDRRERVVSAVGGATPRQVVLGYMRKRAAFASLDDGL